MLYVRAENSGLTLPDADVLVKVDSGNESRFCQGMNGKNAYHAGTYEEDIGKLVST